MSILAITFQRLPPPPHPLKKLIYLAYNIWCTYNPSKRPTREDYIFSVQLLADKNLGNTVLHKVSNRQLFSTGLNW